MSNFVKGSLGKKVRCAHANPTRDNTRRASHRIACVHPSNFELESKSGCTVFAWCTQWCKFLTTVWLRVASCGERGKYARRAELKRALFMHFLTQKSTLLSTAVWRTSVPAGLTLCYHRLAVSSDFCESGGPECLKDGIAWECGDPESGAYPSHVHFAHFHEWAPTDNGRGRLLYWLYGCVRSANCYPRAHLWLSFLFSFEKRPAIYCTGRPLLCRSTPKAPVPCIFFGFLIYANLALQ